jgi:hypothetical protein
LQAIGRDYKSNLGIHDDDEDSPMMRNGFEMRAHKSIGREDEFSGAKDDLRFMQDPNGDFMSNINNGTSSPLLDVSPLAMRN